MTGTNRMVKGYAKPRKWGARRLKICLAASGGGHVRQLLDLEPLWSGHDVFFVTERTALGESIAADHRTYFVSHFAAGQCKRGNPLSAGIAGVANFFQSAAAVIREHPDVLITTGAGSALFATALSRFLGARTVVIDSFARFERPSKFLRVAAPFAHERIVQSPALSAAVRRARVFDPFRVSQPEPREKESLLFATVGATLPFDRLVDLVGALKARGDLPERVIAQVGKGGRQHPDIECVETLPFEEMRALLARADLAVCHGGTGSLITALEAGCGVVAIPRRHDRGEHYDNHQVEITSAFKARGLLEVADTVDELAAGLARVRSAERMAARTDYAALAAYLESRIEDWFAPDADSAADGALTPQAMSKTL